MSKELDETTKKLENVITYGTSHPEIYKTELDYANEKIESQAREIEELKADSDIRLQLLNDTYVNNDELRAGLVDIEKWLDMALDSGDRAYLVAALTRCKEALK